MSKRRAILIAGPTASGKSSFALALAKKINSVIVNADAMQVYKELYILTARPGAKDLAACPHRLYGHVPATVRYSVGTWLQEAAEILQKMAQNGLIPIFVGGTGLYFKALNEGLSKMPTISAADQEAFLQQNKDTPTEELYKKLKEADPASAAKLTPGDRQRILRALLLFTLTGQSLLAWQASNPAKALLPLQQTIPRVLLPSNRQWLYKRIDARVYEMVKQGALLEAENLAAADIPSNFPAMQTLGVRHFKVHLVHESLSLEEAISRTQRDTRRYAKRQLTWLRNQMQTWPALDPVAFEHDEELLDREIQKIKQELAKQA